jgi:hypothetical protein
MYIYKHIRTDKNEVFYIGIGNNKRAWQVGRNRIWDGIVSKTDYIVEIIQDNLSYEEAIELEKYYIKLYGRRDLGTGTLANLTEGGEGLVGLVRTDEHKENISKAHKKSGIIPPSQKGNIRSEEVKKIISEKNKGRVLTDETRKRIANASANRSDEAKRNKSEGVRLWWAKRKNKKNLDM